MSDAPNLRNIPEVKFIKALQVKASLLNLSNKSRVTPDSQP